MHDIQLSCILVLAEHVYLSWHQTVLHCNIGHVEKERNNCTVPDRFSLELTTVTYAAATLSGLACVKDINTVLSGCAPLDKKILPTKLDIINIDKNARAPFALELYTFNSYVRM